MAFWVLSDSTQLTGLEPTPQGVARLTNGKNRGEWSDTMTNGTIGGRRTEPPYNGKENGHGTDGVGRVRTGDPPTTRKDVPGPARGARGTHTGTGGGRTGTRGPAGPGRATPQKIGG